VVTIRSRGRLPHWENTPATYFVTFRLADSLPKSVAEALDAERKDILATARAMGRDLSPSERVRLAKLFSDKIEKCLDSGCGENHLVDPRVALATMQALLHFDGQRYRLSAWCLMPNHVHVVFQPLGNHQLSEILHTWKSYSANQANRILGRAGAFWQREYYDHLVRDEKDFRRIIRYVMDNPRKANLVNWPWIGIRQ
jgi:REP element-mobilizing transposase RayT